MRPESDVPLRERVLVVEGRASASALFYVRGAFPKELPANSEILFISFAYADIPIGQVFDIAFPTDIPQSVTKTHCEIVAVTQQYATPLDEIPHGWKTICLVKFEEDIPGIIESLPMVNGWYENRNTVSLCDADVWRLITAEAAVDWIKVSREAHEIAMRHGRTAHIYAAMLAEKAQSAGDIKTAQFWQAVSRSLTSRLG
ncbi:hypothetical protein [Paraburkholderia acidipaludis]|uniref:hypothetical protein n=1 Tax=Paraburkholderia acidipaludis TaxID=660537 RepID=UPI001C3F228D|nr:hypothetical protein [Paraburkholderia acidipaludis]